MKKKVFFMSLMVGAVVLSGCTSSKELLACQEENRNLTNNYQDTKEQLAVANTRLSSLEEQLAQAKRDYERLQSTLDWSLSNASQNNVSIDKLVDQINESNQYIRHLVEVKSKSDSLNMVLTNNLTRSLSKEELREVDVQVLKGVVYISLADNMLFRSGGYEINDRAAETLSKIAKIIMDYKDYDVLVEYRRCAHFAREYPQQLGPLLSARLQRGAVLAEQLWRGSQATYCWWPRRVQSLG